MSETKMQQEVHPIFRTLLRESNNVTKRMLMHYAEVYYDGEKVLAITPVERYLSSRRSSYFSYVPLSDRDMQKLGFDSLGMPHPYEETMTMEDRIVAKKILGVHMSQDEMVTFDYLRKTVANSYTEYMEMRQHVLNYGRTWSSDGLNKVRYDKIKNARKSGWFDNIPDPDETERKFMDNERSVIDSNRSAIKAMEEGNQTTKENSAESKEETAKKETAKPAIAEKNQPMKKESANAKEETAKKEPKPIVADKSETIKLSDISEMAKEMSANEDVAALSEYLNILIDDKYKDTRDQIYDTAIDLVGALIKTAIIKEPNKFMKAVDKLPSKITIDESIKSIGGLGEILKAIIDCAEEIKNAKETSKSLGIIDKTVVKLKELKSKALSEKFIKFLKEEVLNNETETKQESIPAAAMQQAPAMMSVADTDDGTPSFLKVNNTDFQNMQVSYDKPAFIQDAMSAVMPQQQQMMPMVYIDDSLKQYPWVKEITDIAQKHSVFLTVNPHLAKVQKGDESITAVIAVQFAAIGANSTLNYPKSFTIDLGYIIDRRPKLFFNAGPSGFNFMEKCEFAINPFIDAKKGTINSQFFEKLFQSGKDSFTETDMKNGLRMYSSNYMQLNRVVEFLTVPTGSVNKEYRKALKDSLFIMMPIIKEISKRNNLNLGRFVMRDFDRENLSYTLDNASGQLYGVVNSGPAIEFSVTIKRDTNGNVIRDNNTNKVSLAYSIKSKDIDLNTIDIPNNSKEESVEEDESSEMVDATFTVTDATDESETPSILQQ